MIYTGDISAITLLIKHKMLDMDKTQKDICNATGWAKSTVSNLLGNKTDNPSINTILSLCDAIDCDLHIDITPRDK